MPRTPLPPTTEVTATPVERRSLAPDLARGLMLLVIATVHAHMFRQLATGGETFTLAGTLDTAVTAFMTLFAEARGYPMFAALFGYGLALIYLRRTAEGRPRPWVRSLVRRRGGWMILIGFLHTALLFYGDVIATYGLIALLLAGLLHRSDHRLLAHGFAWASVGTLLYAIAEGLLAASGAQTSAVEVDPLTDLFLRLSAWPVLTLLMVGISVLPFTVGVWAARRRLLEEPELHLRFLRRVAGGGIALAVIGAIPHMFVMIRVWNPELPFLIGAKWLHVVSGYAGGFGYAALIALVAVAIGDRRGPIVGALVATGRRSMTCYLLQSVAWVALFLPYTMNLAERLNDAQAVLVGAGVWAATVVIAAVMERFGLRGPAETFLRRMTYGGARRKAPVPVASGTDGTGDGAR
ncbi:DUF418 domain-containing protein [Nocardiopsis alba]|jgi:uncharacterized protein|uniref:DUF418 domain-containing protein n=1 Tax=Nocardiopsis alba TaxID=53437 RepID=UPI00034C18AE|nr:DUF418 domain-containing protein [Nocardiopsis alba]